MKILFKVTAHFGISSDSEDYYVVAHDSAKAESAVKEFHERKDYPSVAYCNTETIAQASDYGKPCILLHGN